MNSDSRRIHYKAGYKYQLAEEYGLQLFFVEPPRRRKGLDRLDGSVPIGRTRRSVYAHPSKSGDLTEN